MKEKEMEKKRHNKNKLTMGHLYVST